MDEIKEVFSDIRETVGDKWFFIFIGVAVVFGLYNLVKGSNTSSDELVPVKGVYSYPDVVTNANVVIDTLQDSLEYSENRITDKLDVLHGELSEQIQFTGSELHEHIEATGNATNDFINSGFESQEKLLQENFDNLQGSIESGFETVMGNQGSLLEYMGTIKSDLNNMGSTISHQSSVIGTMTGTLTQVKNDIGRQSAEMTKATTTPKATTSTTPKATTSTTPKASTNTSTYKYTTKAGLNTSTSIVDALKATGTDSSFENRAKIYKANGGQGMYTGSYSQNVSMLNSLKAGTLKKV